MSEKNKQETVPEIRQFLKEFETMPSLRDKNQGLVQVRQVVINEKEEEEIRQIILLNNRINEILPLIEELEQQLILISKTKLSDKDKKFVSEELKQVSKNKALHFKIKKEWDKLVKGVNFDKLLDFVPSETEITPPPVEVVIKDVQLAPLNIQLDKKINHQIDSIIKEQAQTTKKVANNTNDFKKELAILRGEIKDSTEEQKKLLFQADELALERSEALLNEILRLTGLSMGTNVSMKKQNFALKNLTDELIN